MKCKNSCEALRDADLSVREERDKINSSRATRDERQNPYEHQNASTSRWDLEDAAEEPEPVEVALNRVTRDEVRLRSEPHCKAPQDARN